ncbi:Transposon Ty3-G Gag-Pol poly [Paramuricea clavata]|uniref:Transposon Ty3-G Gag-Pol poly n=1 Tax=Paramuricea clavata TaxID=317549 RepID=A0A7D9ME24_PARCT|nr:Transposon Ty3-G Gag-Pol poly [Paramuricea clavata]
MSVHGTGASASACAKHLANWCASFGVPSYLTTDRGPQFTSKLWEETTKALGIKHRLTTSYHPQHNGKVERSHRSLKNSIRARLDGRSDWLAELPWVLLGLRNSPNTDSGISPAELVFGEPLRLPGNLQAKPASISHETWAAQLRNSISAQSAPSPEWHTATKPTSYIPKDLDRCEQVLIRQDRTVPSLRPKYTGPFPVLQRSDKVYELIVNGKPDKVSVDRLKPFYPTTDSTTGRGLCRESNESTVAEPS